MTITVGASAITQSTPFPDSLATTKGIAAYCGARSFSFSPNLGFLTVTGGNTLNGNQTLVQTYATVYTSGGNGESDTSGPTKNRIGLLNA